MATKTIDDLIVATSVSNSDKLLVRQGLTDKTILASTLRSYILDFGTLTSVGTINDTDTIIMQQGASGDPKTAQISQIKEKVNASINAILDVNFIGTIQSVQNGQVDGNNLPNHFTISGDILTLRGATTPFRCNLADGFSDYGKKAYRININDDTETIDISALGDGDYYIIGTYDEGAETFSLSTTTTARIMSTVEPASPSDEDLWYNINTNEMLEYDSTGATWNQVYKIVLGMVNKASGSYTIYNRAFNDYYYDEFAVAIDNRYLKSHNIFTDNINAQLWHYDNEGSPSAGWIQNFINRDELGGATRYYGASLNLLDRTIDVRYNDQKIIEVLNSPAGYSGGWIYPTGVLISATNAKLIVKRSF